MADKILAVTIEEDGNLTFLATDAADAFLECGEVVTRRASHVEPASAVWRVFFHILRWFGDKNRIAEWTRTWKCLWRVNTKPVGGPILRWTDLGDGAEDHEIAVWENRQQAIDAEIRFLNDWFVER